jgi:hypothetical protein
VVSDEHAREHRNTGCGVDLEEQASVVEAPARTELTVATRKQRLRAEAAAASNLGNPVEKAKPKPPKKQSRGK